MVHVPYKGAGDATVAVVSGQVHMLMTAPGAAIPFIRSGRLRALAVGSARRVKALPEVPTMAEAGLPGCASPSCYGAWAPMGTRAEIVHRINARMQETKRDPAIVERLTRQVLKPVTEPTGEAQRFIAGEIVRAGELLRSVHDQPA